MKTAIAITLAVLALSGWTHDNTDPVPTFDPAQDWQGNDSPVLSWTETQRQALIDHYAQAAEDALSAAGLDATTNPDATAIDTLERAQAVGESVPRPVRELALLTTARQRTAESPTRADEASMLDTAWKACEELEDGKSYADLVYAAAEPVHDPPPDGKQRDTLVAVLYAPIICPNHTDDALNTIAGIDGSDALD